MRRLATHIEEVLAGALLGVMAVLAFVNILARYLTRYSFAFTEEIEVAALVWITMLGAALGVRETAHLGFTMLRHLLPKPARQALAVSSSVVAIATVTALMWAGARDPSPDRARDDVGGVRHSRVDLPAALPVGGAFIVVRLLQALRTEIRRA